MNVRRFGLLIPIALLIVACAAPSGTSRPPSAAGSPPVVTSRPGTAVPSGGGTTAPTTNPTTGATTVPTTGASPSALPTVGVPSAPPSIIPATQVCGPIDSMPLKNPGRLTLSTDNPAFPPWWGGDPDTQYPNEPEGGSGWGVSDPYSMEGFEGATAYAIADAMGFTPDLVDWIPNTQFAQAFAPGDKPFDFHMAQISIRPKRAEAVDFTEPYFDSNQALLALTPNAITGATSIADLQQYKLGAQRSTTSFDLIVVVIQPTVEPQVYPDNTAALTALKNGQIDGLVVDLSTAFFMRDAEIEDFDTPEPEGTIVGQFGPPALPDEVGAVLQKGSELLPCVNAAIEEIKANGTLQSILDQWINTGQEIPFLQ